MFSKALFKQSYKANGMMWLIITFAVCFMLASLMLISGTGNIGKVKNGVQDTIIVGEIDASTEKRAINYYCISNNGLKKFDSLFLDNYNEVVSYSSEFDSWVVTMPASSDETALSNWRQEMPTPINKTEEVYAYNFNQWLIAKPNAEEFDTTEEYNNALNAWSTKKPVGNLGIISATYGNTCLELEEFLREYALSINPNYKKDGKEADEIVGVVMYNLNPNGKFDSFYEGNNEPVPLSYDYASLLSNGVDYRQSAERISYINERSKECASIFLAGNMTKKENIDLLISELSKYNVDEEKYESFGYTYENLKHLSFTTIISFQVRYDYELRLINEKNDNGEYANAVEYQEAVENMQVSLISTLTDSLMASLPASVSEAISDIGKTDLYGLIVGSIFFKMAGLLLPIIYMIMASNNLIVGQVDSGSMAYVLSTSTKRRTVTFTQAVFLISSLFAMFICTTITSLICYSMVDLPDTNLTNLQLVELNIGSFLALFAMSGLCFFTSCFYDRSKRSMAIGGGLSMFFLVATMLGLFGSPVIPSVVRLSALNFFNYVSIISLFDSVSILSGDLCFLWKLAILLVIGLTGYIVGSKIFEKKDLPL